MTNPPDASAEYRKRQMVQFHDTAAVQLSIACQLLQQAIRQLHLCLCQQKATASLLKNLSSFPRVPAKRLQRQSVRPYSTVPSPTLTATAVTFPVCNGRYERSNEYSETSTATLTAEPCMPPPPKEKHDTAKTPAQSVNSYDLHSVLPGETTAPAPNIKCKDTNASEAFTTVTARRRRRARGMDSTFASPNLFSVLKSPAARLAALGSRITKRAKECTDQPRSTTLQVQTSRRNKHERRLGSKKGAAYCRTTAAQSYRVQQYQSASSPSNVWNLSQSATSKTSVLQTSGTHSPTPPATRSEQLPHDTNSNGSRASLPSLQSTSDSDVSHGRSPVTESLPPTPPRRQSESGPYDHSTVCSWHVQDLRVDHEWHNPYFLGTDFEAQRLVPPARKLTEQEVRTIPYVVSESEYLIQQKFIDKCTGDHNTFLPAD